MSLLYEQLKNPKQKLFVIHSAAGNSIKKCCEFAVIARDTYYEWIKNCVEFKEACDEIEDLKETLMVNTLSLGSELAVDNYHYFPYLKYWLEKNVAKYKPNQTEADVDYSEEEAIDQMDGSIPNGD